MIPGSVKAKQGGKKQKRPAQLDSIPMRRLMRMTREIRKNEKLDNTWPNWLRIHSFWLCHFLFTRTRVRMSLNFGAKLELYTVLLPKALLSIALPFLQEPN